LMTSDLQMMIVSADSRIWWSFVHVKNRQRHNFSISGYLVSHLAFFCWGRTQPFLCRHALVLLLKQWRCNLLISTHRMVYLVGVKLIRVVLTDTPWSLLMPVAALPPSETHHWL
jgi:hypothetical protein